MSNIIKSDDYITENSNYLEANPTWHTEDSPWKATQILKMIERNSLQPKTVVEIGCGAGEILNQLHQRIADKTIEFSGYEIAPDARHDAFSSRREGRWQASCLCSGENGGTEAGPIHV